MSYEEVKQQIEQTAIQSGLSDNFYCLHGKHEEYYMELRDALEEFAFVSQVEDARLELCQARIRNGRVKHVKVQEVLEI